MALLVLFKSSSSSDVYIPLGGPTRRDAVGKFVGIFGVADAFVEVVFALATEATDLLDAVETTDLVVEAAGALHAASVASPSRLALQ
jgi:hypothetical protein